MLKASWLPDLLQSHTVCLWLLVSGEKQLP